MNRTAISLVLLLSTLLSACGAQGTPTLSAADVQSTAMAGALTVIAQTQAAIPTETPVPPTETSVPTQPPTNTPVPPPTLEVPTLSPLLQPTTAPADNSGNPCVRVLNVGEAGPTHRTLVKNQTGGKITLSLGLYKPNAFGQCGYISYNLNKGDSVLAQLPAGYWYAYAWVNAKGKQYNTSGSFFVQPAQFDKIELCVRKENIIYIPSC